MRSEALQREDIWGWARDGVLALILTILGGFGLRVVHDTALWNRIFGGSGLEDAVGQVIWEDGVVRRKASGTVAWRDVSAASGVAVGDMVFTGEDGRAAIVLNQGGRFEVEPNSLIRIDIQTNSPSARDWWPGAPKTSETVHVERGGGRYIAPVEEESSLPLLGRRQTQDKPVPKITVMTSKGPKLEASSPLLRNLSPGDGVQLRVGRTVVGGFKALPSVEFRWDGALPKDRGSVQLVIEGSGSSRRVELGDEEAKSRTWLERLDEGEYRWRLAPTTEGVEGGSAWTSFKLSVIQAPKLLAPGAEVSFKTAPNSNSARVGFLVGELSSEMTFEIEYQMDGSEFRALRQSQIAGVARLEVDVAEGAYLWRARAVSPRGERSDWSERSRFRVGPPAAPVPAPTETAAAAPEAPAVPPLAMDAKAPSVGTVKIETLPADLRDVALDGVSAMASTRLGAGSDLNALPVVLNWKAVPGVTQYAITVRDTDGETVKQGKSTQTHFQMIINSVTLSEYSYQISATLPDGRKALSSWLPIRVQLAAPVPRRPANGALVDATGILLTWESTVLTSSYRLQISERPDFLRPVYDKVLQKNLKLITLTEIPITGGTYYWRVQSLSGKRASFWSSTTRFRVNPATAQKAGAARAPGAEAPAEPIPSEDAD